MADKTPPSRPALRKSVDAAVHPALGGRASAHVLQIAGAPSAARPAAVPGQPRTKEGGPLGKAKGHTSDVLRPTKHDPAVTVTLTMPKSLRKRLRALAKAEDVTPEALAVRLLAERIQQLQEA